MDAGAYVSRRKRRRVDAQVASTELQCKNLISTQACDDSAMQETSWTRQELGIAVEGDDPIPPPIRSFSDLWLPADVISVLESRGMKIPSAIQTQALPCITQGRDVIALAPTASGKTLCYILPVIALLRHQLAAGPGFTTAMSMMQTSPCALIIVPTRELVDQVVQVLAAFFPGSIFPPILGICGGVAIADQISQLQQHINSAVVVVATPGRLLHLAHCCNAALSLENVSLLVIDEVDHVLEAPDLSTQLNEILLLANATGRQTILLSATLPALLPRLARSAVERPVTIRVESSMPIRTSSISSPMSNLVLNNDLSAIVAFSKTSQVIHDVQFLRAAEKPARLLRLLRATKHPPVLVFCNLRSSVERVARLLRSEQFHVAPLHGGKSHGYRSQTLRAFRAGYVDVLVATDVASRGLDLPGVDHVVLFDMPSTIQDYIHRCGRTGRHCGFDAGVVGKATSFVTHECTINNELKQVLLAAGQPLPRELKLS